MDKTQELLDLLKQSKVVDILGGPAIVNKIKGVTPPSEARLSLDAPKPLPKSRPITKSLPESANADNPIIIDGEQTDLSLGGQGIESFTEARDNYEPLMFDNPIEFLMFFHPALSAGFQQLYNWQTAEQLFICDKQWSPKNALEHYLIAANGSGKDSYILAGCALFLCCCTIRHRIVITTNDSKQMLGQTYPRMKSLAQAINKKFRQMFPAIDEDVLTYKYGYISCPRSGGDIVMFVTDEAGRAEGYHPADDHPEAALSLMVNEGKNIKKDIYQALKRCRGYSRYIVVSSTGFDSGYFYEETQKAIQWPAPYQKHKAYARTITSYDCPAHVSVEVIERDRATMEPWLFDSTHMSKFSSLTGCFVLNREMFKQAPKPEDLPDGGDFALGLDLSLGGDECSLFVRRGPKQYFQEHWRISDTNVLEETLITTIKSLSLPVGSHIYVDVGGLGKPIYQHLVGKLTLKFHAITNQSKAYNKIFRNVGAEDYFHQRTLLIRKMIPAPTDEKTIEQSVARRYILSEGAIKLEAKEDARARGDKSPDRSDARVLAYRRYRFNEVNHIKEATPETPQTGIIDLSTPDGRAAALEFMNGFKKKPKLVHNRNTHDLLKNLYASSK